SGRHAQLLKQLNVAEALGIPLRRTANAPQTFAVPVIPKKLVVKPPSSEAAHKADPTLDDPTYQHILSIIHDAGVGMERLPSTYANKKELNSVLKQIATGASQHPCFVRLESKKAGSWLKF